VAILGCTYALADWALTYVDNFVLTVSEGLFIKLPTFLIKYLFKGLLTVGELVDKLLIFIFGSEEGK
jgi:predicted Co/Zn/Cd cation transporter (cation efflux family)